MSEHGRSNLTDESPGSMNRAALPTATLPTGNLPTVGIVGGLGRMGQWLANILSNEGVPVLLSDRSATPSLAEVCSHSQILVFSVPIRDTVAVIESALPYLAAHHTVIDLTSLKVKPVEAMLRAPGGVLGLHPMFGPSIETVAGQTIVACRARDSLHTEWVLQLFKARGALIKETTPEKHDQMMAVIQGLNHLNAIALARCLQKLEVNVAESLEFTSPIYRIRLAMSGRVMDQAADLYADIAIENPMTAATVQQFIESTQELLNSVTNHDREAFLRVFTESSNYLGDFRTEAYEETNRLIEALSELRRPKV